MLNFLKHRSEAERIVDEQERGVRETMIQGTARSLERKDQRAADQAKLDELAKSGSDESARAMIRPDVMAMVDAARTFITHAQRLTTKADNLRGIWQQAESLSAKFGVRNPVPRFTLSVIQGLLRATLAAKLSQADRELAMELADWLQLQRHDLSGARGLD